MIECRWNDNSWLPVESVDLCQQMQQEENGHNSLSLY